MNEKIYSTAYLAKVFVLIVLLGIQAFFLTQSVYGVAGSNEFLSFEKTNLIKTGILMLTTIYTYSLTVGAWKKNEQYLIVPLPLALGVFLFVYTVNPQYAATVALFIFILSCYEVHLATRVKDLLIRFDPIFVFKLSSKGLLLSFCLVGAFFAMVKTSNAADYNVAPKIGEFVTKTVGEFLEPQLSNNPVPENIFSLFSFPPDGLEVPQSTTTTPNPIFMGFNIEGLVTSQVDKVIQPYVHLIKPLISLVVFGVLQLVAFVAGTVFIVTSRGVFFIAKGLGFLKITQHDVKQEVLEF